MLHLAIIKAYVLLLRMRRAGYVEQGGIYYAAPLSWDYRRNTP
jgi:hypothetical protein